MTNITQLEQEVRMPIVKIKTNRQVTIPKVLFDELCLKEGQFVEVIRRADTLVIKPKALLDQEEVLTEEEEKSLAKGLAQLDRGLGISWPKFKKQHGLAG